jgi:outer membrane protein assembly factor BamB
VHILNVTALDKTTGNVIWQNRLPESWGTPAAARVAWSKIVADGNNLTITATPMDVIVTAHGDVVRVSDGKALARNVSKLDYCSPIVENHNTVYFIENGGKAISLKADDADTVTATTLWTTEPRKDRYYGSPVILDGVIYACNQANIFSAIDATTGKVIYEQTLNLGKGACYPSVTLAGGLLFVGNDNGTTIVLKPGRTYEEVATNRLEPYRSSPVFVGDRMYVHGLKTLYCIGKVEGQ